MSMLHIIIQQEDLLYLPSHCVLLHPHYTLLLLPQDSNLHKYTQPLQNRVPSDDKRSIN